ncbi:tyrosine-protein phosphatase non-receptor type 1-like isoform X2 [Apostichopus japonicus]|uniref:tyrosine-protein phosphatase non-receptor type 1-like isoform X2 n=1 Tax=Stichopus japonicus TaxID=307972 RepID=UPI003AB179F5
MKSIQDEFNEIEASKSWHQVFLKIRQQTQKNDYSLAIARNPRNKRLNRYRDVSPYDHSRVKLEKGDSDYINASLVEVPEANRKYILAQGPLDHTVDHFWQMVWEQKSKAIIMLTNLIERGTIKCSSYYPREDEEDHVLLSDDPFLKVTCLSVQRHSYYRVNTFELEEVSSGKKREVLHFHYASWSDFSVPQSPEAFLKFLHQVRLSGSLDSTVGPPVIHCSAGIGRSGTFCLVDSSLVLIKKRGGPNGLQLQQLLLEMRKCRMGLIQTPEQLRFSYIAVLEGANTILERGSLGDILIENNEPEEAPPLPPRVKRPNSSTESTPTEETKPLVEDEAGETKNSEQELRKRKRDEKKEELAKKVSDMKKKMKTSESWNETRPPSAKARKKSSPS